MLLPQRTTLTKLTRQVQISQSRFEFLFPSFHCIPVITRSCTDLERLSKLSPKISILYSVSSVSSVISAFRSSPPSTSSCGWPVPSSSLTITTNVSKASSSASQARLKLSGVMSETRRACTSGSVSEWQGKVHFLLLWRLKSALTFEEHGSEREFISLCANARIGYIDAQQSTNKEP